LPRIPSTENASRSFFDVELNPGESIYGVTASGESPVNVWYQTQG
jgi:hypothetical protein